MRIVENACGEGCLTVIEGRWWWLLAMKIVDRLPLPLKVWCWFYDHTTETVWRPGHIGEEQDRKLLIGLGRDDEADAFLEEPSNDGRVYLDATGPGEPKVIQGEDRILEAMTRAWEGRGQVYAIDLRAMAASLHNDGHPHDADHCDLCQHESAGRDGGESHG